MLSLQQITTAVGELEHLSSGLNGMIGRFRY